MADQQYPDLMGSMLEETYGDKRQEPNFWQRYMPMGSAAMAERGPWMRDYLPSTLADFLASAISYGPAGLGSRAGNMAARDISLAHRYATQPVDMPGGGRLYPHAKDIGPGDMAPRLGPYEEGRQGMHHATSPPESVDWFFSNRARNELYGPMQQRPPMNGNEPPPSYGQALTDQLSGRPETLPELLDRFRRALDGTMTTQPSSALARRDNFRVIPGGRTD